jgi:MFS transporter, SET family, sugar efflux transporter
VGRRIGILRVMVVGALFAAGAYACFALIANAEGMFAGQILMGAVWGIFAGLGIVVAQRLLPFAVATATAIFLSSTSVASALGGVAGSIGVSTIGLPSVFLIPAAFAVVASAGLVVLSRSRPSSDQSS